MRGLLIWGQRSTYPLKVRDTVEKKEKAAQMEN